MCKRVRLSEPGQFACLTSGCPFVAEQGRDYCCNRCPDQGSHSRNCASARLLPDQNIFAPSNDECVSFHVPWAWDRGADKLIMEYLNWFATRYETISEEKTVSAWEQTEMLFNSMRLRRPNVSYVERRPGPLRIHASAHSYRPHGLQYIDVDTGIPVTAHGAGDLKRLTGCDFVVMATLASQQGTALALRLAMLEIETQGLKDLVFTCRHGIHRSVGCACLLVMLFYPEAKLVFHTKRAMEAAWSRLDPCSS